VGLWLFCGLEGRGNAGFGGVKPWNGQLFHVEQFEKGRKCIGFGCF